MYISPFWCGVAVTLIAEFTLLLGTAIITGITTRIVNKEEENK